ncbi:MAG: hypothetical protein AAF357_12110 [Verrucomicrobiota bacterium]
MKRNLILYILLIFLVLVNGFFLYNYLGISISDRPRKLEKPTDFIIKELDFNTAQLEQFRESNRVHNETMMRLSEDIRDLKNALFDKLSEASVDTNAIDSITSLLGQKEKEKRTNVFYHFKEIQTICDDKQREKFNRIISDALHNPGNREQNRSGPRGGNERRPPPPNR